MRRLFEIISAATLFCAGMACGWLMRGAGGRTGVVTPVLPVKASASQATAPNGRDVRPSDEADVTEPQFAEAISAAALRRRTGLRPSPSRRRARSRRSSP